MPNNELGKQSWLYARKWSVGSDYSKIEKAELWNIEAEREKFPLSPVQKNKMQI